MSKKKYSKSKYKANQKATMDELFNKIKEGIKEIFQSDKWKNHLETISKFHNYSQRNILLIEMQNPNAKLVAGYKKWQTEFDRQVKKGEKAIKILMPIQIKKDIIERDDKGNPIVDEEGKLKKSTNKFLAFKYTNVFDISQTKGKELDLFKLDELESTVQNKDVILKSIKEIADENNCIFRFDKVDDAKGYYSITENEIVIKKGMSDLQTLKTAVHELAHSMIHNPNSEYSAEVDGSRSKISQKEIEAESIAYVVLHKLGLDTSDYSFGYIASWGKNKTEDELSNILNNIKDISSLILNKIDNNIEVQKNINLKLSNHVNKVTSRYPDKLKLDDIMDISKNTHLRDSNNRNIKSRKNQLEL